MGRSCEGEVVGNGDGWRCRLRFVYRFGRRARGRVKDVVDLFEDGLWWDVVAGAAETRAVGEGGQEDEQESEARDQSIAEA